MSAAPTAMQLVVDAQESACCVPYAVFGVVVNDQALPLQRPNNVACVL
jgi:hypothetical protein